MAFLVVVIMEIKPFESCQALPTCVTPPPPHPGGEPKRQLPVLPGCWAGHPSLGVTTPPTQLRMGEGVVSKAGAGSSCRDTGHSRALRVSPGALPGCATLEYASSQGLCRKLGWLLELVGLRVPVAMPLLLLPAGGETEPLQPRVAAPPPRGAPFQPPATDAEPVAPSPSLGTRERAGEETVKQGEFRSLSLPLIREGCLGGRLGSLRPRGTESEAQDLVSGHRKTSVNQRWGGLPWGPRRL